MTFSNPFSLRNCLLIALAGTFLSLQAAGAQAGILGTLFGFKDTSESEGNGIVPVNSQNAKMNYMFELRKWPATGDDKLKCAPNGATWNGTQWVVEGYVPKGMSPVQVGAPKYYYLADYRITEHKDVLSTTFKNFWYPHYIQQYRVGVAPFSAWGSLVVIEARDLKQPGTCVQPGWSTDSIWQNDGIAWK